MTRRYEIQDIVSQDGHGVIFQALDRETGEEVVLRRFFPFGPDGGGLQGEERDAYGLALDRLKQVRHPTLRTILDGGCDPVDGIPYLVTESLEGETLEDLFQTKSLSAGSAKALLDHALEASQMLAQALGEEAIWVETEPATVILSQGTEGRGLTFWISPIRWLGSQGDRRSLAPLVALGEAALHWQGRVISPQAGEGLGAWFQAVKDSPERWTLEEARATLHASGRLANDEPQTIVNPPMQGTPTVAMPAPAPRVKLKQKSSMGPLITVVLLTAAVAGILIWKSSMSPESLPAPIASNDEVALDVAEKEIMEVKETPSIDPPSAPTGGAASTSTVAPKLTREEELRLRAEQLAAEAASRPNLVYGEELTLEGRIISAESSGTGLTLYLEFAVDGESFQRWAGFLAAEWPQYDLEKLRALVNSRARFRGVPKKERSRRKVYINMADPEAFTVLSEPAK